MFGLGYDARAAGIFEEDKTLVRCRFWGCLIVVELMVEVSGLAVMIVMADIDKNLYVDEGNENLVNVLVTKAAEMVGVVVVTVSRVDRMRWCRRTKTN